MYEDEILRSWEVNAAPWTRAIQSAGIASRVLVTDAAIIEAVRGSGARTVLDVGCGEGWLARALGGLGLHVVGIDAVSALVTEARRRGGEFHVATYADIAEGRFAVTPHDAVVCNFSLLGAESVEALLGVLARRLSAGGQFIVQTLHPVAACGDQPYRDGWRAGSWAGFSPEFSAPAPWYFRTLQSWHAMLRRHGLEVLECREPTAPGATAPSSVIFVCRIHSGDVQS